MAIDFPTRSLEAGARGPRVLIIAESANPEWVSVPLEGWNHARALLEVVDGHLVTQVRNADAIGRTTLARDRFTAIDSEMIARPVSRLISRIRGGEGKGWTTAMALSLVSYLHFEELVWRRFGPAIQSGAFDIVHRITPLSPTLPSPIARRCARAGVPFIVGPLNGGVPWPRWFDRERRREREWLSYIRAAYRLVPGYRSTLASSTTILVGSTATLKQVPLAYRSKAVFILENGVDPTRFSGFESRVPSGPLGLVFVGRLVPYKGADMLIEAAAPLVRENRATLSIIGDGPERPRLQRMVHELGLGGGVHMTGWLPQQQVGAEMAKADLFVFPSIREFGGAVVLEAMASGVPPVVVDYGGPGDLVVPGTGFKVPIGPRESIVSHLRRILERTCDDPSELPAVGARGRARVMRLFTWEAKAAQVRRVYEWVLDRRGPAPQFGFLDPEPSAAKAVLQGVGA